MNLNEKKKLNMEAVMLHENAHEFFRNGKIDEALELYQSALEIATTIDAFEIKAHALSNSAQLFANKGDFNTALSYMEQSIEILKEIRSPELNEVTNIYDEIKSMQSHNIFESLLKSPKLQNEIGKLIKIKKA